MPRSLNLIAACVLALVLCSPGRGQDSHPLGDVARQSQKDKDKDNKPPVKVITNEDMSPVSDGISSALGTGPKRGADKHGVDTHDGDRHDFDRHDGDHSAEQGLERLQSMLNQIAAMDRDTLARNVLGGNTSKFPGREKWEDRLFAAKQTFVSQSLDALQKAKQVQESSEGIKGTPDTNDPRVKTIVAELQQILQQTQQANASFQAVIEEGKGLADKNGKH
jgi:hypothetical protein